ncbi:ABC transporter ATP-binding protein [Cypionkella sp.]|uniref:ABC transporter ATP-binding protein n=1 Tax=Cypionkella sp. TaxID=2811411 RepID=UPI0026335E26|nr:ABC transporter ATP-binding protein [Cypionkella sp.]MDB5665706.1 transporter ATP-binding protein [Cypionkella sp.]
MSVDPGAGVVLSDLRVRFATRAGSYASVRDVGLTIGSGRILGLVGESGSGKSTVALALLGLLAANATVETGSLQIGPDTYDLATPGAVTALRGRKIAMVFQDPFTALNPVFTIRAHLEEALSRREPGLARAEKQARMVQALADVGLDQPAQRLSQYPHHLSGGMRQRVAIAMALLAKPDLLIADEPTTALDATVEAQVMQQICALRDRIGCSVLLITHSLGLVTGYCDDIAVMYAGEIMEHGPVARVAAFPKHPYTKALLACEIGIDEPRNPDARTTRFRIIPGDLPDPLHLPTGCIFAPRCDFVIEACTLSKPPLIAQPGAPSHVVRCLRAGEVT